MGGYKGESGEVSAWGIVHGVWSEMVEIFFEESMMHSGLVVHTIRGVDYVCVEASG